MTVLGESQFSARPIREVSGPCLTQGPLHDPAQKEIFLQCLCTKCCCLRLERWTIPATDPQRLFYGLSLQHPFLAEMRSWSSMDENSSRAAGTKPAMKLDETPPVTGPSLHRTPKIIRVMDCRQRRSNTISLPFCISYDAFLTSIRC